MERSSSVLTLSTSNTIRQWNHNPNITNPLYIVASAFASRSIFGTVVPGSSIGPDYLTVSVMVPLALFTTQQWIYYAEILPVNGTNYQFNLSHYVEKYQFSVLNSPTVNCTNFLQRTKSRDL